MKRQELMLLAAVLGLGLATRANAACTTIPLAGTGWYQDQVTNNTTGFALAEQVAPSATGASVYRTDNATGQSIPPGGYCLPTTAFASIGGIDVYAGLYRTAASNGTTTNDWTSTAPTAASYDVSGMVNYNLYNNGSTAV
jgi:hypothetical protein